MLNHGEVVEIGTPKDVIEHYLATVYESNQEVDGVIADVAKVTTSQFQRSTDYRDMREAMINASNLRNDIEVFQFEPDQKGFGTGDAKIVSVRLLDPSGAPLSWVVGGEDVILEIRCSAHKDILRPIVGFQFKDRLGQVIFCDNTYFIYQNKLQLAEAGTEIIARFEFRLPVLPSGDYSISPAIAEGTQEEHIQHHWLHDAMMVRVHSTSVCLGLIGVPMKKLSLETQ